MATNLSENGKLKLDLFSLQFFKSLYQFCSLTKAAEEHGFPVSSASRHLAKLRDFFGDQLFTHCGTGMTPTPRADRLMPQINAILKQINGLLAEEIFEPSAICATVRIGLVDNAALTFVAPRANELQKMCPDLTLELIPLYDDFFTLLSNGQMDFAVYPFSKPPERPSYHFLKLGTLTFSYVVRKRHPLTLDAGGPGLVTEADAERFRMVRMRRHSGSAVNPTGTPIKNQPKRDPVAVYTSYFLSAPFFILETDQVLVLPTPTAEYLSSYLPIQVMNLCPDSPPMDIYLIWHERVHASPALQWIRSFLVSQKVARTWRNLSNKPARKSAGRKGGESELSQN